MKMNKIIFIDFTKKNILKNILNSLKKGDKNEKKKNRLQKIINKSK